MSIKAKLVRASLGFLLLFSAASARAQDVRVNCSGNPTCTLTPAGGISWANGNLTWVFKPLNPRVSVYIFVHNLNPTSAHSSQTVQVFQSPFSQDLAPNLNGNSSSWTQDTVTQNGTTGASCNNVVAKVENAPGAAGLGTCYVTTMFAAQVAIRITGASAQSGSPDNFELAVVQETGTPQGQSPGGSSGSLSSTNSGPSATSAIQVVSDGTSQAFVAEASAVNPAATSDLLILSANNGTRALYLDKIVFSTTSTTGVLVNFVAITNLGGTCTNGSVSNLKLGNATASTAITQQGCTTHPNQANTIIGIVIPAGGTTTVDLRGLILPSGTLQGLNASCVSAVTGQVFAEFFWYEK